MGIYLASFSEYKINAWISIFYNIEAWIPKKTTKQQTNL